MGVPEMYPEAYRDHLTGDPVYDKAFAALADCPTFNQVEQALRTYAHELAEKQRDRIRQRASDPRRYGSAYWAVRGADEMADLIDPEVDSGQ